MYACFTLVYGDMEQQVSLAVALTSQFFTPSRSRTFRLTIALDIAMLHHVTVNIYFLTFHLFLEEISPVGLFLDALCNFANKRVRRGTL